MEAEKYLNMESCVNCEHFDEKSKRCTKAISIPSAYCCKEYTKIKETAKEVHSKEKPQMNKEDIIKKLRNVVMEVEAIQDTLCDEISRVDPTEGGKYVRLDTSRLEVCKAWGQSQLINHLVDYLEPYDEEPYPWFVVPYDRIRNDRIAYRVPADCITEDGMPTGRALVELWCRVWHTGCNENAKVICKIKRYDACSNR